MDWNHGGDWAAFEYDNGTLPLDFSISVSPLGMPEGAKAAAIAALANAERYPDPFCRRLRKVLSDHHGVSAEHIVCGAGAADLIYRAARVLRPSKAVLPAPTFSEYEAALDCEIVRVILTEEQDFSLNETFLEALTPDVEAVFLCNPNNPTGRCTDFSLLWQILRRCEAIGAVLVVDECFLDFTGERSMSEFLQSPNLVVLKAFTKTYAMAGLRLGYALCGDPALAERFFQCAAPWAVSSIAQAAGISALKDKNYVNQLRIFLQTERPRMANSLIQLGLRVIPSDANFLLFQSADTHLCEKLRTRGILLRDCRNFIGLSAGWYRAAIRTSAENDVLLAALREVL